MADTDLNQIDDDAAVEADLARLRGEQTKPPTPPPEGTDTGLPPVEKPLVEVKPEAAPTPTPEPKPEPKPAVSPEQQQREGTLRRLLRERDREVADLRRRMEALEKPPETKPADTKDPTFEDDAAVYLKNRDDRQDQRTANLEQEIQRLRGELGQRDVVQNVQRQEDDFRREHPDYDDARTFLEAKAEEQWVDSGLAALHVDQLRDAVRRGHAGESQFKAYADHYDQVAQWDDVAKVAEKEGREPEDVALWKIARDTYIAGERQKVVAGAQAKHVSVALNAYNLAQKAGYQAKSATAAAPTGEAARQRVLQAQAITAASNSLSETSSTEAAPGPRVIRNRSDIVNLNDAELDSLIESGRFKEL